MWSKHLPLGKKTGDPMKDLMQIFPDQYKGIGKLPGKHKIELKNDADPIQLLVRNVPEELRQPLKEKLGHMERRV